MPLPSDKSAHSNNIVDFILFYTKFLECYFTLSIPDKYFSTLLYSIENLFYFAIKYPPKILRSEKSPWEWLVKRKMTRFTSDIVNEILLNGQIRNNFTRFRAWIELLLVKRRFANSLRTLSKDKTFLECHYEKYSLFFDPRLSQIIDSIELLSNKEFLCNFARPDYVREGLFPLEMSSIIASIELMKLREQQDFKPISESPTSPQIFVENEELKKTNETLETKNKSLVDDNIKLQEKILSLKIELSLIHEQYFRQLRTQGLSVKTFVSKHAKSFSQRHLANGSSEERVCKLLIPDSLLPKGETDPTDPNVETIIEGQDALEFVDDKEIAVDVTTLNENFEPLSPPIIGPKLCYSRSYPKSMRRISIQKVSEDDQNYQISSLFNEDTNPVHSSTAIKYEFLQGSILDSHTSVSLPNDKTGIKVVHCKRKDSRYGMQFPQTKVDKSTALSLLNKDLERSLSNLHRHQSALETVGELSNYYDNISRSNVSLPSSISEMLKCNDDSIGESGRRIIKIIKSEDYALQNYKFNNSLANDIRSEATDYDIEDIMNDPINAYIEKSANSLQLNESEKKFS